MPEEQSPTEAEAWVYVDFVQTCLGDRASGRGRTLEEYQARYPGHGELITAAWNELAEQESKPAEDRREIGPYRLLREIGRGGQAVVYLAEHTALGRQVALKVLLNPFAGAARQLRFEREAAATSRLDHSGIGVVYESGQADGVHYIAMRHVDGATLAARTAEAPDVDHAVDVIEQVARALHAAHEAQVVHRDVKPGNIMVTPEGRAVVLDFGLAQEPTREGETLTATGDVLGTPAYMAPEQVLGDPVDRRADVWAAGVTLYELATGRRPFAGPTRDAIARAIVDTEPESPRRVNPAVGRDLDVVIRVALEKDPDRRYATALAFAEDLQRVREQRPIEARPTPTHVRFVRWVRREPVKFALFVVMALLPAAGVFLAARWDEIRRGREVVLAREVESELELGFLELAKGDAQVAIRAFERALVLDPDSVEAQAGLAFANDDPDAVAAIEQRMTGALSYFIAGRRRLVSCNTASREDLQAATDDLLQAVLLSSRGLYHFELAHAVGHLRDEKLARQLARGLEDRWPESPVAGFWTGFLLQRFEPRRAVDAYRRCVKARPRFAAAWFGLGRACDLIAEYDESARAYEACLEIRPGAFSIHWNLAHVLERATRFSEAHVHFKKAHELGASLEGWRLTDSQQAMDRCGRSIVGAKCLADWKTGRYEPQGTEDDMVVARVAYMKRRFEDSMNLYAANFALNPELATEFEVGYRFRAALAAVRARKWDRALSWLEADVEKVAASADPASGAQIMLRRKETAGMEALWAYDDLPATVRERCERLWARLDGLGR